MNKKLVSFKFWWCGLQQMSNLGTCTNLCTCDVILLISVSNYLLGDLIAKNDFCYINQTDWFQIEFKCVILL